MNSCINCGSEDFVNFFVEEIPCCKCDNTIEIEYVVCNNCGMVSKLVNGEFLAGSVFTDADTKQLFDSNLHDLIDMLSTVAEADDVEIAGVANPVNKMTDMLHKCIRCGTRSYEKERGVWHCPDCGFEWEVIPGV